MSNESKEAITIISRAANPGYFDRDRREQAARVLFDDTLCHFIKAGWGVCSHYWSARLVIFGNVTNIGSRGPTPGIWLQLINDSITAIACELPSDAKGGVFDFLNNDRLDGRPHKEPAPITTITYDPTSDRFVGPDGRDAIVEVAAEIARRFVAGERRLRS